MSTILYYSNYCENCKKLLPVLYQSNHKNDIHFICIDKRVVKNNNTYLILENNSEILLPNTITSVPALLLIRDNYKILKGDEIYNYLKPVTNIQQQVSQDYLDEPSAFMLTHNSDNIASDNYSFLDQNFDELSAKGSGGTRQMYNYADINFVEKINTPTDDYTPDKIGEISLDEIQKNRNT